MTKKPNNLKIFWWRRQWYTYFWWRRPRGCQLSSYKWIVSISNYILDQGCASGLNLKIFFIVHEALLGVLMVPSVVSHVMLRIYMKKPLNEHPCDIGQKKKFFFFPNSWDYQKCAWLDGHHKSIRFECSEFSKVISRLSTIHNSVWKGQRNFCS